MVEVKKDWEDREKTVKSLTKEVFKMLEIEFSFDSFNKILGRNVKCRLDLKENERKRKHCDIYYYIDEKVLNRSFFFKPNSRQTFVYDIDYNVSHTKDLNIDFRLPVNFAAVQTKAGRVFITGGSKNESESLASCWEFIESENTLAKRTNMLLARESHAMISLNARYIMTIGSRHTS
jgi:hypothetical protein